MDGKTSVGYVGFAARDSTPIFHYIVRSTTSVATNGMRDRCSGFELKTKFEILILKNLRTEELKNRRMRVPWFFSY